METTGRIDRHAGRIQGAASLLSQFATAAQENLYTVAVDKAGTIVEVHRHTKVIKAASYVDLVEIAGRIFNTPSPNDLQSHRALIRLLKLKRIDTVPMIIARDQYITSENQNEQGPVLPPATAKSGTTPVKERYLDVREDVSQQAMSWMVTLLC